MDAFLNPNTPLTPFITGFAVTLITNTLWYIAGFSPVITALILSILFGLLIVRGYKVSLLYKGIYFLLNTLIVFSLAYSNTLIAKNILNRHVVDYYNTMSSEIPAIQREYFVDWFNIKG